MSTSGPLLPTKAIEEPAGIPHSSVERVYQEALIPSPSSVVISPNVSPTKPTSKSELIKVAVCGENTANFIGSWTTNDLENEVVIGFYNNEKRDKLLQENRNLPQDGHSVVVDERLSSSRKEVYHGSREWNAIDASSSNCGWDKGNQPDMYLDGGGDGLASVESDDDHSPLYDSSTPPAARWAVSLRNLLSDKEGCDMFEIFLNEDRSKHSIKQFNFWYACRGLKRGVSSAGDCTTEELISIIWSRFIEYDSVKVSKETKAAIREKILSGNVDTSIFDQAQLEVEALMNETLYPNFLKSDLYTSHYLGLKEGCEAHMTSGTFGACAVLPTLHEDSEYDQPSQFSKSHTSVRPKNSHKLTSDNLRASALYRANIERTRPEENAGFYLKGDQNFRLNPYNASYRSGHVVSQQDSELQSLSSGALTDDTKSYTDSSVDGIPLNSKHFRKHEKSRIRESAICNKEDKLLAGFIGNTTFKIPRTMRPNTLPTTPNPANNPQEFAKLVSEKLIKVLQEKEISEKLQHTFCKLNHSEDNPEEALREHAVNSLPPNLLANKLNEKKVLDEPDFGQSDQSILDNHIRNWDPSTCSPGSPKYAVHSPTHKGGRGPCTRQLPHLIALPQNTLSQNPVGAFLPKCISKSGKHHSSIHGMAGYPQFPGYASVPQSLVGTPLNPKGYYPVGQNPNGAYIPQLYQLRNNNNHGRRRERGQDVYSTFSSDSGNVADYHDGSERIPPSHLPKSKSMPEYIENQSVGAVSDGGSSGGRRQGFGSRRSCRRPAADLTDSGVSVISDSGRSAAPSSTSERVETWLLQSKPFASGSTSQAVAPVSEMNYNETSKVRGTRSTTHTVAGFTSLQRLSEGSVGRRSLCSSSTSAATCVANSPSMVQETYQPLELSRDSPLGQSQQYIAYERRKTKGGNGSSSSKSTGQGSCHGDGTGSNGSTLKKTQRIAKCDSGGVSSSNSTTPSQGPSSSSAGPLSQTTTIIYNFSDDEVPFMVKVSTRPVLLKKFKEHLPKKGVFRFYFKKVCEDVGTVFEEITEESEALPLYEGKVFSLIHKDDSKEES